ncbi:MAG TPA: 4Fe-4S ferredoxin [Desulfobacterales bacterium]|nr:4Fe-4S ferredoxin [Desulfobacterales bacterium]
MNDDKLLLKKDYLTAFLRQLNKDYRLIVPQKNRHGDTLFSPAVDIDSLRLDLANQPQNSIKQFMLPQREVLFTYESGSGGDYRFHAAGSPDEPTIYFGVRPCDLSALLYMDVIFLHDAADPHYLQKREHSVIIGLNCKQPFEKCFCNATGNGPFLEFGADLQFTDLGDCFLVEPGRAKGEEIIRKWPQFFSPAADEDINRQYQSFLEAKDGFSRLVHVDQAVKRLRDGEVAEAVWQDLSLRCQDCGGCAYVCPTCTCFTISDYPLNDSEGERVRTWDACTFAGFTALAGGHNPVNHKQAAIRQRFMHKLKFDVEKHGRPSCVGCGRCVDICFGGTDIVRFINKACEGI